MGSGPNAEKSGQNTLPFLSAPSAATYSSGIRPASAKTRSPFPTPSSRSAFAKRLESSASSAKLTSRGARSRLRKRSAVRPARGPFACRSTASCAMFRPRPEGKPSSAARAFSHVKAERVAA